MVDTKWLFSLTELSILICRKPWWRGFLSSGVLLESRGTGKCGICDPEDQGFTGVGLDSAALHWLSLFPLGQTRRAGNLPFPSCFCYSLKAKKFLWSLWSQSLLILTSPSCPFFLQGFNLQFIWASLKDIKEVLNTFVLASELLLAGSLQTPWGCGWQCSLLSPAWWDHSQQCWSWCSGQAHVFILSIQQPVLAVLDWF